MITVTVDDSAFRDKLRQLHERTGDLTEVMDKIGDTLETRVRQRFETKTDPSGKPWAQWKESTRETYPFAGTRAAASAAEGPGKGLLLDRYGTMLDHLSYSADSSSVRIGFAHAYATHHEYGTRTMERRGMLMADPSTGTLGPSDEAAVLDILSVWLDEIDE